MGFRSLRDKKEKVEQEVKTRVVAIEKEHDCHGEIPERETESTVYIWLCYYQN